MSPLKFSESSFLTVHQEHIIEVAALQSKNTVLRYYLREQGSFGLICLFPAHRYTTSEMASVWMSERSPQLWKKYRGTVGITAVGMFGKGTDRERLWPARLPGRVGAGRSGSRSQEEVKRSVSRGSAGGTIALSTSTSAMSVTPSFLLDIREQPICRRRKKQGRAEPQVTAGRVRSQNWPYKWAMTAKA
jgi:hypothetical protein